MNVVLIQFRGKSVWLHSITGTQDVSDIYDYVQEMLGAERYVDPPPPLAGRHFQRYVIDTVDDRHLRVEV